ncbi:MAG TPA: Lrp/AsnC family transcriptional regulator [Anaerolineales bacterium]|nr:Lrp/AsnC family transcriptional regulator [Anaerolineales bacterium]
MNKALTANGVVPLDETDHKILALLKQDARLTNAAIGEQVGLTASSVFERVKKLVVHGYTARINHAALGQKLTAFVRLSAAYDEIHDRGMQAIADEPEVVDAHTVAGEDCLIVKVKVRDTDHLHDFLMRAKGHVTLLRAVTMISMAALKE